MHAWPALVLTAIALALLHASKDPKTSRGDAVMFDFCLGVVATVASVLWLRILASVPF